MSGTAAPQRREQDGAVAAQPMTAAPFSHGCEDGTQALPREPLVSNPVW